MNYLAHAALSQTHPEITLGNLIADHVRGPNLDHFPEGIAKGIKLHRQIDTTFDTHPEVIRLRALMPQGLRRYSGIAIDFWFDHLLARQWQQRYPLDLEAFQLQVNQLIDAYWSWIPASQQRFMNYLKGERLFLKYQSPHHIEANVHMVAQRLKRGDKLIECMKALAQYKANIEQSFESVYPQMERASKNWINSHV